MGTQISFFTLGRAVSSSSPNDFQPNSQKGSPKVPQMTLLALSPPPGRAYIAVGTKRAVDSETGLPRRSTSALWMLLLLMPAEVRRSFIISFFLCRRQAWLSFKHAINTINIQITFTTPQGVFLPF